MAGAVVLAPSNCIRKISTAGGAGIVVPGLNPSEDSATLSASGLATLKELAAKNPDSILILDSEVAALLTVKPLTLRDPQLAVACAQREVLLTKRTEQDVLLSLAQAYRSAGQFEQSRATATEGLALLLPLTAGTPASRTRKLLELVEPRRALK